MDCGPRRIGTFRKHSGWHKRWQRPTHCRDRTWNEVPYLAAWLARPLPADESPQTAADLDAEINGPLLNLIHGAHGLDATLAVGQASSAMPVDESPPFTDQASQLHAGLNHLDEMFAHECNRLEVLKKGDARIQRRLDAVLAVPFVPAQQRSTLRSLARQVALRLNDQDSNSAAEAGQRRARRRRRTKRARSGRRRGSRQVSRKRPPMENQRRTSNRSRSPNPRARQKPNHPPTRRPTRPIIYSGCSSAGRNIQRRRFSRPTATRTTGTRRARRQIQSTSQPGQSHSNLPHSNSPRSNLPPSAICSRAGPVRTTFAGAIG